MQNAIQAIGQKKISKMKKTTKVYPPIDLSITVIPCKNGIYNETELNLYLMRTNWTLAENTFMVKLRLLSLRSWRGLHLLSILLNIDDHWLRSR